MYIATTLVNNWQDVWALAATLLGSGVLTVLVYALRNYGLPDKTVPLITHVIGVLVPVLIVLFNYLATNSFTWPGLVAAVITGIIGANTAAGLHGNAKALSAGGGPGSAVDGGLIAASGAQFPRMTGPPPLTGQAGAGPDVPIAKTQKKPIGVPPPAAGSTPEGG